MMQKYFLLVDDDADDRFLFSNALKAVDPQIICKTAEHGKDAFKVLSEYDKSLPDIIFLDINMAEMNGWECLTLLKKDEKYKNIPVIMYSTSNHQREVSLAIEFGAIAFCTKPEDYNDLIAVLKYVHDRMSGDLIFTLNQNSITEPLLAKYLCS